MDGVCTVGAVQAGENTANSAKSVNRGRTAQKRNGKARDDPETVKTWHTAQGSKKNLASAWSKTGFLALSKLSTSSLIIGGTQYLLFL